MMRYQGFHVVRRKINEIDRQIDNINKFEIIELKEQIEFIKNEMKDMQEIISALKESAKYLVPKWLTDV